MSECLQLKLPPSQGQRPALSRGAQGSRRMSRKVLIAIMAAGLLTGALAGCGMRPVSRAAAPAPAVAGGSLPAAPGSADLNGLISQYAAAYGVPETLVHRVVQRESRYDPGARNGRYMGLMQIDPRTAATMGYAGPPEGLLDAETNLRYAVKYLRGAWMVSDGDEATAVGWYARGYYYEAKRRGLLQASGLI